MNRTAKVIGLLVLGAVLGQVLLIGVGTFRVVHKVTKDPSFLLQTTMLGTAPDIMSNDELGIWNNMRDDIRHERYADVNQLIQISPDDLDFEVIPAKPLFTQGDSILAEVRFKNLSSHPVHINEPRIMKMTLAVYDYQGLQQLDYNVTISPLESTWMRTIYPGDHLSIPILIEATKTGSYKVNYSLSIFHFNEQHDNSTVTVPVIKRTTCNFAIQ